jgi:hypothetical protein
MLLVPRNRVTKGKLGGKSFLFNPSAFHDNLAVQYNQISSAGISYPILTYGGGVQRDLSFTLYLNDALQPGITKEWAAHIHTFLPPSQQGFQFKAPPIIQFAFGWFVKDCYLTAAPIDYTEFSPDLEPTEATINITLLVIE